MKIDRLIGIIVALLQNEKMTAPELAERFEVSRRTINRDIEDICKAGIPIITTQGSNGGISIMENYKIEKTLFSEDELCSVFTGLLALDSVAQNRKYKNIIDKFTPDNDSFLAKNHILIDLSSYYKDTLASKIELLRKSIDDNTKVSFRYHNQRGEHTVIVAPYLVIFQWSSWYLLGFDDAVQQFKLYKLNRISEMVMTDIEFEVLEIPKETLNFSKFYTDEIQAVILFQKSEEYRLIEEYGTSCYSETPEGLLRFSFPFTNQDYLLSWVLSFGEKAELIEPAYLRPLIKDQLETTLRKYSET